MWKKTPDLIHGKVWLECGIVMTLVVMDDENRMEKPVQASGRKAIILPCHHFLVTVTKIAA